MKYLGVLFLGMLTLSCVAQKEDEMKNVKVTKTDQEWKAELTPEQYYVLRQSGTEHAGTGEFNLHFEDGNYTCAGCGAQLFTSGSKFESHCGWPSFDRAANDSSVVEIVDNTHGMMRTEIRCANCNGHLGHVFNDGPTGTGLRYCINSQALEFDEETAEKKED